MKVIYFLISLNQVLPIFELILSCESAAPFKLYQLLVQLLGALSLLNESFYCANSYYI